MVLQTTFWNRPKIKLVPVISILIITGFLVTSLASYVVSRTSIRSEISLNILPQTSDNIYSEIQRDLLRPIFISSFMATDTFLRDWVIGGEKGEQEITKYLKEIQTKYRTVTSFFVSEKTRNYYQANGILKKVTPGQERDIWYFRVRDLKSDYEINIDPDLANRDTMTIFINYRVLDYDNKFIGVTGVGLTVSAVKKLIESYQKKYNRTIYFIDRRGEIKLAGSDFDNTVKNISQLENHAFMDNTGPILGSSFAHEKIGKVVHTNIRYIDELDWYIVVEQPEQKNIKRIFNTFVINLGICVLITVVVLILVNSSLNAYQKKIETLRGIVPICSYCKKIRDDKGYWNQIESYIQEHSEAEFSHSICQECAHKHYPDMGLYDNDDEKMPG